MKHDDDKGSRETQWDDNSVYSTDAYPAALPAAVSDRRAQKTSTVTGNTT